MTVATTTLPRKNKNPSVSVRVDHGHDARPGVSWRSELGLGDVRPIDIPADVAAEQLRYGAMVHNDVTKLVMGDPLPGRSALDQVPSPRLAPATKSYRQHGLPPGVRLHKFGRYEARITKACKTIALGYYDTPEEAHAAYRAAASAQTKGE